MYLCLCFTVFLFAWMDFYSFFSSLCRVKSGLQKRLRTVVLVQTPCGWPPCFSPLLRLLGRADDGQVGAGKPSESRLHSGNLYCAKNTMEVISGVKSCGLFAGKIPFGNLSQ